MKGKVIGSEVKMIGDSSRYTAQILITVSRKLPYDKAESKRENVHTQLIGKTVEIWPVEDIA
ncbi:unnamed protein product [marine sediment metagenome]|uniref:Uncharacterized protein n=1 Tax=marine sediment metagenome TaxID=412755 RepID=X1DIB4_9ZZZZ